FLVFLDAAYFRLRGSEQEYGLSGRGVAIDTGRGDAPEEFPDFTTFWVIEPEDGAPFVDIVALLDGPSVTGAYLFRAQPGSSATLTVRTTVFLRKPVETLGLAPLTSMFVHGSNGPLGHYDDFRPEVHDSDGLFLRTASEPAAWRPLINGRPTPRTSTFTTPGLESFALLQRQRRFDHYVDTRARYEDRPGVIVDVGDDFPKGDVRLYEIPSPEEYMDNIVAYVSPSTQPTPGAPLAFSYRLSTVGSEPVAKLGQVIWTRIGSAERMRYLDPPIPGRRIYFIDWAGEELPRDPTAKVTAEVIASTGTIVEPVVEYVAKTRGWRVYFEHRPFADAVAELRATLHLGGRQIVETWLYGT
ncbi:MAG TPA: glucan biosynthesis protein, partial [Myxococcota bacterium]|nr:glucan biosynthesis protein [Myxococcota bacterium]